VSRLLSLDQVSCHYDTKSGSVRAVDQVSIAIHPGETVALVGESGCGKSTLAKVILGLAPVTSGTIHFDGIATHTFDKAQQMAFRKRVQVVFQDPYSSLNPRLRVSTILGEPMWAHGFRGDLVKKRTAEVLEMVGLRQNAKDLFPHEFSGGQRQRVAVARALMLAPDLIILDEPISALDVSIRAQILNLLQDIQAQHNIAYLLIAHDLGLVEHASQRVAVMYLGRVVEMGITGEVFTHPEHPYTRALLSAVPQPDPSVKRNTDLIQGDVASALHPPTGCHFHPRCPHADRRCQEQIPPEFGDNHVKCWLSQPARTEIKHPNSGQ
jgi:peptide/nickel transport system ATP-binding protein